MKYQATSFEDLITRMQELAGTQDGPYDNVAADALLMEALYRIGESNEQVRRLVRAYEDATWSG